MSVSSMVSLNAAGTRGGHNTQPGQEDKAKRSPRESDIQLGLAEFLGLFQVQGAAWKRARGLNEHSLSQN